MLKGGISDPRNKALMKMFNMIGIGERAGSGVPDIFAVWESQGWKAPEVEEQYNPDRTILTLSFEKQAIKTGDKNRRQKQAIKTGDNGKLAKTVRHKQTIMDFIQKKRICSTAELSEQLGLSLSRTRALLAELVDEEKIAAEGDRRSRHYRIF